MKGLIAEYAEEVQRISSAIDFESAYKCQK